jgi:hypothetical protein
MALVDGTLAPADDPELDPPQEERMKAVANAPQAATQRLCLRLRHTIPLSCPKRLARLLPSRPTDAESMVGGRRNRRPIP